MHPQIEGYCIAQTLQDKNVRTIIKSGKEHAMVYFNINSFLLPKNRVIICNDWILFETYHNQQKALTSLLKKSGFNINNISKVDSGMFTQIYTIEKPEILVEGLLKFEELLKKRESDRR